MSVQCESRPKDARLDEILNTDDLKQRLSLLLDRVLLETGL